MKDNEYVRFRIKTSDWNELLSSLSEIKKVMFLHDLEMTTLQTIQYVTSILNTNKLDIIKRMGDDKKLIHQIEIS